MNYLALARKWRPQKFEDVIGQKGVVATLENAIGTGRLAQSFIFAGPRGVGKTTTARILARALNCVHGPTAEPCGTCDACTEIAEGRDVDVMEIDGATYTGVDAVREVIVEPLGIAPMRDRYKIFIIDEVHRLSKSAFDALLKSVEEPPPYVKFMMATTELSSVPATIQSRSQVFELRSLPFGAIRTQLRDVTAKEGIAIDDAALALVARSAEGSMRDALSALDQVLAFTAEAVTAADVSAVLGLIGRDLQFEIAETVAREDVGAVFELAGRVVEAGFDLRIVCREMARLMRDVMIVKIDPTRLQDPEIASEGERERLKALADHFSREDLLRAFDLLSRTESDIRYASQPRQHFEMALAKWIYLRQLTPLADVIGALGGAAPVAKPAPRAAPPAPRPAAPAATPAAAVPSAPPAPRASASPDQGKETPDQIKETVLGAIRAANKVFYGMVIAQAQRIEVASGVLTFTFTTTHKTLRARLDERRAWIEDLARDAGTPLKVLSAESAAPTAASAADARNAGRKADLAARAKAEPSVQAVLDVFGGEIESVEEL